MNEKPKGVNIAECVGVSVEAATILGLDIAKDPELLAEVLKNDYTQLIEDQPRPGEPFIHLPLENDYQLRKVLDKFDGHIYGDGQKYPNFSVWHETHWTHGAHDISHLLKGLGRRKKYKADISGLSGQSRLAFSDGENAMFPYAHFVNMPFDHHNVSPDDSIKDSETQKDAFKISREQYESDNPDFDMFSFDVATLAMLSAHQRIKGEKMPELFGTIIIPELGRKRILGGSALAIVHLTATRQFEMGWTRGDRSAGTGIGISVGYNKYIEHLRYAA
ncbi:MAG: hypothetical protein NTV39_02325 [Candidatus Saccharibacteria bacterium]|nr:hypothetical protein [Candidatus Saccharibacteria bacterium]